MHPAAEHAIADLTAVRAEHTHAHRCIDGNWWNPNAGSRERCPTWKRVTHAEEQIHALAAAPAEVAADPEAQTAVMEAMTGFTAGHLEDEDRQGWTETARMAMEATAAWLSGGRTA